MHKILVISILQLVIPLLTVGQPSHEEIIKRYLNEEVYFGEFELLSQNTERLTKEEYEFRKNFRKTYLNFINDIGNVNGISTSFELEAITDFMINESYIDMFEGFESILSSDLVEFASIAKIDPERFRSTMENARRFYKGWQDEKGSYYRTTWLVNSEGDKMILYFYLNEQQEVIEFQEDFPDI